MLKGNDIGLIATVQHVHKLDEAKEFLTKHGKTGIIGKGDSRVKYDGQVLGCNFSAARVDVDEFVYIGSGDFHPLGHAAIARAMDAKSFGIIVGAKRLQMRLDLAEALCQKAKKRNLDAHIIFMNEVKPAQLAEFKVDAFVNTACPRITIDDVALFKKPVLTPIEFEIILGERDWGEIKFDEILG